MKNQTQNQTLEFKLLRNAQGNIMEIQMVLNERKYLHLHNNTVNTLGDVEARTGFHGQNVPITLTDKHVHCTANVPTLITIMRKWVIENIIEASTLTHHVVYIVCMDDATIDDIDKLIISESRKIRTRITFLEDDLEDDFGNQPYIKRSAI